MPRYVNADRLRQELWDYYELAYLHDYVERCDAMMSAIQMLSIYQTEDVAEVKHGGWIKMSDVNGVYWSCSECGEDVPRVSYYCPNCGARMDGDDE